MTMHATGMIRRIIMIEAVAVLLFFIVAGTLWGIVETFKYRKNRSEEHTSELQSR